MDSKNYRCQAKQRSPHWRTGFACHGGILVHCLRSREAGRVHVMPPWPLWPLLLGS
jgi:hypothetical protein